MGVRQRAGLHAAPNVLAGHLEQAPGKLFRCEQFVHVTFPLACRLVTTRCRAIEGLSLCDFSFKIAATAADFALDLGPRVREGRLLWWSTLRPHVERVRRKLPEIERDRKPASSAPLAEGGGVEADFTPDSSEQPGNPQPRLREAAVLRWSRRSARQGALGCAL